INTEKKTIFLSRIVSLAPCLKNKTNFFNLRKTSLINDHPRNKDRIEIKIKKDNHFTLRLTIYPPHNKAVINN
ncbi:hypothetical protein, partial [Escherichia coli]|uniref:hypothetical protein n=1 Tax=Escherichia coli TaxID=562 RepID=UPI0030C692AC